MFNNRTLLIVTKHQKENVISYLFEKKFDLKSNVSKKFDTDTLGTFSGEIERLSDPLSTLRNKCLEGMKIENSDLAVSNEGSFGPHPQLFFAPVDNELAIFIDKKHDIEIIASETSMDTNFGGRFVNSYEDLLSFASDSKFPSHALILRKQEHSNEHLYKGIANYEELKEAYFFLFNSFGTVFAETDMRAMYNPSRMKVIKKVFEKLIVKINCKCPNCSAIGFDIVSAKPGLPCSQCGFKTNSILLHQYQCKKCNYLEDKFYPNGFLKEDPMYCDICNP